MYATIVKNKFRYLLGAILIVVMVLAISAYRSGIVTKLFSQDATVTQERARRDAVSARWYAAQERARRDAVSANWYATHER